MSTGIGPRSFSVTPILAHTARAAVEHLLLVDVELHVERIELHDGGQLGRAAGADHGARIDEARRDMVPSKGAVMVV